MALVCWYTSIAHDTYLYAGIHICVLQPWLRATAVRILALAI